jgi:hypothetical protein
MRNRQVLNTMAVLFMVDVDELAFSATISPHTQNAFLTAAAGQLNPTLVAVLRLERSVMVPAMAIVIVYSVIRMPYQYRPTGAVDAYDYRLAWALLNFTILSAISDLVKVLYLTMASYGSGMWRGSRRRSVWLSFACLGGSAYAVGSAYICLQIQKWVLIDHAQEITVHALNFGRSAWDERTAV